MIKNKSYDIYLDNWFNNTRGTSIIWSVWN